MHSTRKVSINPMIEVIKVIGARSGCNQLPSYQANHRFGNNIGTDSHEQRELPRGTEFPAKIIRLVELWSCIGEARGRLGSTCVYALTVDEYFITKSPSIPNMHQVDDFLMLLFNPMLRTHLRFQPYERKFPAKSLKTYKRKFLVKLLDTIKLSYSYMRSRK